MRGTLVTKTWRWDPTLHAPARYRKACRYDAFIPDTLVGLRLELSAEVAGAVSDAEQAIMSLNAIAEPALGPLARLLLRTESIASSKVEGLQVGIRQLARGESRLETGGNASATVLEVLGNIDAMQLAVDEAASADPLVVDHVTDIHRELMARSPRPDLAGAIRTVQNWIGGNDYNPCGADFVPPPPEHLGDLLEDLCVFMEDETLPPLVQAALAHAQFETIHPFDDGNGRTGRALIHVLLRRRGLAERYVPPISVILAIHRERYIHGLTRYRAGDVRSWIEDFAASTARAADLAKAYLRAVTDLMADWRSMLRGGPAPRSDAAAWAIIDALPAHPVITAPVAQAATGRAKAAIHNAMEQLVEAGVLEPVSRGRRNRSYEASGLLDLLEGLEAGRAPR
jgi:Fic family protein